MTSRLPGSASGGDLGAAVVKSVLRLAGGGEFADVISDLTGLGRSSVERLAREAFEAIGGARDVEYVELGQADREWAEGVLIRTYQTLARRSDLALARESLVGPDSLAAWAFGAGLAPADRADLDRAVPDTRAYYQLISSSMAQVVSAWYRSDGDASRVASAVALGAILEANREILDRVTSIEEATVARESSQAATLELSLIAAGVIELAKAPDYYPAVFDNAGLARSLRVVELDENSFYQFEGRGLYWDGHLHGEEKQFTAELAAAGELVVLLGNPGSGKSTLAKGFVLDSLRQDRLALYCRLEDFADMCARGGNPAANAVRAFGQSIGLRVEHEAGTEMAAGWKASGGFPLIVLDGLDELATAEQYVSARMAAVALAREGHSVIITSRVAGYTTPWDAVGRHLAIKPLSDLARDQFANAWFDSTGSGAARQRYVTAAADASLSEVLASPLTLGFVCMVAHYERVPATPAAVFSRFVDHFLRAPWRDPGSQRIDPALVGRLKQRAGNVAWGMAHYGRHDRPVWVDIAELDNLQRATGDDSAYAIYAAGLLVPHGPVEPLGGTQQRVRWLHRALHENFVAKQLQFLAQTRDPAWSRSFIQASCQPAWRGALTQAYSLMGEGPELASLVDVFENEIRYGDTPNGHFAGVLTDAAQHEGSQDRRRRSAKMLCEENHWSWAAYVHESATAKILRVRLAADPFELDSDLIRTLYRSRIADVQSVLREALALGSPGEELRHINDWMSLEVCGHRERQQILSRLCSTKGYLTSYVRPLPEPARTEVVQGLALKLARIHDRPRLSLRRAYELWSRAVGSGWWDSEEPEEPEDPRLALAVVLGRMQDNMDYDLSRVRGRITEPLADLDAQFWALPLQEQGYSVQADSPDLLKATVCFKGTDAQLSLVRATITGESQELAVAVLNRVAGGQWAFTWSRAETLHWALAVLCERPSIDAILPLKRFREQENEFLLSAVIDANFLQYVTNAQPWHVLAERLMVSPSENRVLDGQILCTAASLGTSALYEQPKLPRERCVEVYLEGLRRIISAECHVSDFAQIWDLEDIDEEEGQILAREIRAIARGCPNSDVVARVLGLAETSITYSGMLVDHLEPLRLPKKD